MGTAPLPPGPVEEHPPEPPRIAQSVWHALYGALLGTVPLLASLAMRPTHRSPYLLAYPVVILAAWIWGLSASVACGAVAGLLIEYFIFQTHQIALAPVPGGWIFREFVFLAGSVMVGALTRSAARQRQDAATASLNQRLRLAEAEAAVASEKAFATELALENEVRSQLALDGANVGLWEWDVPTQKSKWSHGFYRLHCLDPGSPVNYEVRRKLVHPDDFDRVEAAIDRAIEECGTFHEEYRVPLPDGGVRWVACQGAAIGDSNGKVVKISGYGGDVTRRKLADQALLQNEKMAIAGRLIATIAHEINNPLDAAMNIVYLLRSGVPGVEQAELLDEATLQLERISQISRQTLNFSRVSVRATLSKPSALVDETVRLLAPKLRLAQIEVATEVRGDSEFLCERREAQQILTNIVNNAIEAMQGPGTIRIRIANSVDWSHRKQHGVRISIADSGPGMPPEVLQRIAEPFFTTKEGTGTGLGMWVVRELIKKQNGSLSIHSSTAADHHGTTVSCFIPFAVEPVVVAPSPPAAESQPAL
ncbi:MAG TPA: ATP-binding protein [Acidobacteriaceae bacterium]